MHKGNANPFIESEEEVVFTSPETVVELTAKLNRNSNVANCTEKDKPKVLVKFNTGIKVRRRSDGNVDSELLKKLSDYDGEENVIFENKAVTEKCTLFNKIRPVSEADADGWYDVLPEKDGKCKENVVMQNANDKRAQFENIKRRIEATLENKRYNHLSESGSIDEKCFILNDLAVRFVKAPGVDDSGRPASGLFDKCKPSGFSKTRPNQTSAGVRIARCCGHIILLGCGGVALFIGLILGIGWPLMFNKILQNTFSLVDKSESFLMWKETPLPMYMEVYMFNWTNPATSYRGPDKPNFVEMGPYVFYEHHSKGGLVWNDNNTVTYQNKKSWKFLAEMSNGSLNDEVTNLNVVAMTIGEKCRYISHYLKPAANIFLMVEESLIVTDTVGNLLFSGSNDRILTMADKVKKFLAHPLPYDKFGWFYKRNESFTADGVFTMNTGTDDINKLGLLTSWNYKNKTCCYTDECAKVKGTVGELFPPESASLSDLELFANDLCSVLTLKADKSIVQNNLTGMLFSGLDMFNNKTSCYCANGNCPPNGIRNVSSCKGAPAYISLPHFLNADASVRQAITGMKPDPEKHNFFMVLEQVSSIPLTVTGRLQLNILMDEIPGMNFYSGLRKTYMPMLWFNQKAQITNEMAEKLTPLVDISYYAPFVMFGFATLGAVLITLGLYLRTKSFCQDQDERLLD